MIIELDIEDVRINGIRDLNFNSTVFQTSAKEI